MDISLDFPCDNLLQNDPLLWKGTSSDSHIPQSIAYVKTVEADRCFQNLSRVMRKGVFWAYVDSDCPDLPARMLRLIRTVAVRLQIYFDAAEIIGV